MDFVNLNAQFKAYEDQIRSAINKVLSDTTFIGGEVVSRLETGLEAFCGKVYAVTCASGTDALLLGLMAKGAESCDEILVPAFTYFSTASMVSITGARPVFVDVDPVTFNIDSEKIEDKITSHTTGIIPVSLFGQCADMTRINQIAEKYGLWVMEDAAQSFGSAHRNQFSGTMSELAATSFFPAKPLGCYGDGGAVFTTDVKLAHKLKMIRNHGQSKRYCHNFIGLNSRMDTIQAAILDVKLQYFQDEIKRRNEIANRYNSTLKDIVTIPTLLPGNTSTWAQYTIRLRNRDQVKQRLFEQGIPTSVHYPIPVPRQEAYQYLQDTHEYPIAEELSRTVLSLPIHAFLTTEEQDLICTSLRDAVDER